MSIEDEKAIDLKIKIDRIMESEIGDYLKIAQESDEKEAVRLLLGLDPYDSKYETLRDLQAEVAKIQEDVLLAAKVNTYFEAAIIKGMQAEELLSSEEEIT